MPIRNAATLLRQESVDAATIKRAAEIIEHQVSGMNRLIGDLIDVARMQMGGLELRLARAPLSGLMKLVTRNRGTDLASEARTRVVGQRVAESRVYLNMDVAAHGAGAAQHHRQCRASSRTSIIYVHAKREGAQAVIVVSNREALELRGILSRRIDMIFDLEPGLGLGLYLAQTWWKRTPAPV